MTHSSRNLRRSYQFLFAQDVLSTHTTPQALNRREMPLRYDTLYVDAIILPKISGNKRGDLVYTTTSKPSLFHRFRFNICLKPSYSGGYPPVKKSASAISLDMGLFGKKVTPEEKLKKFRQSIRRSCREIERERTRLQNQEVKMKNEMKRLAAKGETESVMILAKDLVRQRAAMHKFLKLSSQLESLGLRIETIKAQAGATQALRGAAQAMHQLNRMVNVPQMQMIMQKFMMENEMMDMKSEMVDEVMDDVWDEEGDVEEETAAQYAQIFNEIGVPMPPQVAASLGTGQAQMI